MPHLLNDRLSTRRLGRPCSGASSAMSLSCRCSASRCGSQGSSGSSRSLHQTEAHHCNCRNTHRPLTAFNSSTRACHLPTPRMTLSHWLMTGRARFRTDDAVSSFTATQGRSAAVVRDAAAASHDEYHAECADIMSTGWSDVCAHLLPFSQSSRSSAQGSGFGNAAMRLSEATSVCSTGKALRPRSAVRRLRLTSSERSALHRRRNARSLSLHRQATVSGRQTA